ncbi:MAG: type VI secretion system protein TssA [Deltaproteobacteria bacterium]|nr:type VI secretion system protein TssA [Deltaproteobacteria bacterium]
MDLLLLGKEGIDQKSPTGINIRYEPEFDELQAEIDKLSSPTSSGSFDWEKIIKISSEILAGKSKDLLVASYLAVALIHTQKVDGLSLGLHIYGDLLESFWDDLFPPKKRLRGRIGAIEWWIEKSASVLEQLKPDPLPPEKIKELKEALEKVDRLLKDYLDEPPSVRGIERYLDMIPAPVEEGPELEAPKEAEQKDSGARAQPQPQKGPVAREPETIASDEDAQKVFRLGLQSIRKAAFHLRESNIGNPAPYRWTRFIAWAPVASPPPATDGKTMIPPPSPQILADLDTFRDAGNWEALVKLAETTLLQSIFWLDLNRFSWEALGNMGEQYQDAQNAIGQETALLLHRFPELAGLSFSDETPLADNDTRQWIGNIRLGPGGGEEAAGPIGSTGSDAETEAMTQAIQKAMTLARKKKTAEATRLLQQGLQSSASPRDKLHWRMALAEVLIRAKKTGLAIPHLEEILHILETYRLEEWDAGLAVKALKIAHTGFEADPNERSKQEASRVLSRISTLNPVEALRLVKK